MSVDLSDPKTLLAYDEIVKDKSKDWLLLTYGQTRDRLTLFTSGLGGVDELLLNIPSDVDDVYFGFCREREGEKDYYALIAYVPEGISGVRRARALVHSRAVGSLFKVASITVNVRDRATINSEKLREKFRLPPSQIPQSTQLNRAIQRSASEPLSASGPVSNDIQSQSPKIRNFASENQGRVSAADDADQSQVLSIVNYLPDIDDDLPPPTPPKDWRNKPLPFGHASTFPTHPTGSHSYASASEMGFNPVPSRVRAGSRSELAYNSDGVDENSDEAFINPTTSVSSKARQGRSQTLQHRPLPPRVLSPSDRARIRLEAQRKRETEEAEAQREEAERQARLKAEKEEMLRLAVVEEDQRLARIEEEKRRALAERARREMQTRLEEERRFMEAEIRREQERERRLEQARRLEEERIASERRAAEAAQRHEEEKRLMQEKRRQRMKEIQQKFAGKSDVDPVLLSGSITIQTSTSISWKRRFFELTSNELLFYRDSRDRASPLDIMSLGGGRVGAIKEPSEGYEELEAIPHSFAVEFTDGDGPWCLFADSAEDKDVLVSLLSQAAGL